ncbi:MAG: hypothetical protein A3G11_00610 [Candidatus Lloydbacteria bacterium RIFCSPLOWO2_12_FULL_51_9]|uniref:Uncharacterized protein n=2 Tax=Candidatus Lloydiibacteriota TaxID=1817910 RepID=A0A1G2DU08_9BACT|nr:MAG: hypothetical protein A3J08_02575 [Candidatus Lloydbacteria bacterium RIFCSPLOWO2_02_FULL_51_11]OGZ17033.1 MAG: hypothetical protein A3G11_00610 [Candidatus Lloydbacteria bacterium RIFCSPLOWO2_12_FULL_51_9]
MIADLKFQIADWKEKITGAGRRVPFSAEIALQWKRKLSFFNVEIWILQSEIFLAMTKDTKIHFEKQH